MTSQLASQKDALGQKLRQIPQTLNDVGRTASYGSWFNFFLCKADVSVNGTPIGATSPALANADGVCTG